MAQAVTCSGPVSPCQEYLGPKELSFLCPCQFSSGPLDGFSLLSPNPIAALSPNKTETRQSIMGSPCAPHSRPAIFLAALKVCEAFACPLYP